MAEKLWRQAIRAADTDDISQISQIIEAAYAPYIARMGKRSAPMDADIAGAVGRGEVFVIEDGGEIVGFIFTYPKDNAQFIENIAVHPRSQRQGIGRHLLAFAQAEAYFNDLDTLYLYTNLHMTENLVFYPSCGFVETRRITEDGFERVYFEKRLGQ